MPANTVPIFPLTPVIGAGQVSVINTGRDGTGTLATILTGGANGTRVHKITIHATVTTTAGMVRLFIDDLTNKRLWKEIVVTAITVAASTAAFDYVIELYGEAALHLPNGYILKAGTEKGEAINVIAEGGNY